MLKKRIIPKFLLDNGRLVKGVHFHENFREAGNPVTTAKVYDSYGVDEMIFLDIKATEESRTTTLDIIEKVSREVFMPFTVGGGVCQLEDVYALLRAGADKVAVQTAAVERPALIKDAAQRFGSQCIVVGVDYKEVSPGIFRVFTHGGKVQTDFEPVEWSLRMQEAGCGEILLCSIDRDGTMSGYDTEMVRRASAKLEIPLVASSGAGSLQDCIDAFKAGASALTISSMFLFTDQSPIKVRSYLVSQNINVRASKNSRN